MTAFARHNIRPVEQRQRPRTTLARPGRFVFDDNLEHRCRSIDISPVGMALLAATRGKVGQKVVCYLDDLGRFEGRIARLFESGFAMEFSATAVKQEQLADQLAWCASRSADPGSADEPRPAEGAAPARTRGVLRLPDARRVGVKIIDQTPSGAAVICPIPVTIGAAVFLGERRAEVTRVARTLVALRFDGLTANIL